MDELMEKVLDAFKKEFGEDAKLEEGDELVFELNDCSLILSLENGKLTEKILGNKPIKVDYTTGFYGEEE